MEKYFPDDFRQKIIEKISTEVVSCIMEQIKSAINHSDIEERAKLASEGYDDDGYSAGLYMGYVEGAEEQKAIDDAKLLKLKSAWEKQAQINHDDEANYKQVYHDAIEKAKTAFGKACGWLSTYLWYNAVVEEFIKNMEE